MRYVPKSDKLKTEVDAQGNPDSPKPEVIQLSDDELEVLGPLVEQLEKEEKTPSRSSPKTLEEWDDYPLPSWMVQDSSDDEQEDGDSSPIRSPPLHVTLDLPAGGLDEDARKHFKAKLEACRAKYRRCRRKGKDDVGAFGEVDDEFNFDMSEWGPDSMEFDGAVKDLNGEEDEQAERSPPPPPCEPEQLSPILSTQLRPSRITVSTSTPNLIGASARSTTKDALTTPKKRGGGEVTREDYDRDAKILLFDDSSFAAASQKHETAEKLYTATQLTSLLNKTEATAANNVTSHSVALEASNRADSADMFQSEDDDVFRDLEEDLIRAEEAKENVADSFKVPNLGAFEEATASKTPGSSKFRFQNKIKRSSNDLCNASVSESPLNSSVVILDSDNDSPVARIRKKRRLAFEDSDATKSQETASQASANREVDLQSSIRSHHNHDTTTSSSAADRSSSPVVRPKKNKKRFNKFLVSGADGG